MNYRIFFLIFLLIIGISDAKTSQTSVWFTKTVNGRATTFQSAYYQSFKTPITETQSVSEGDIGLGSISGSVGSIRTYSVVVEKNEAGSLKHSLVSTNKWNRFSLLALALFSCTFLFTL